MSGKSFMIAASLGEGALSSHFLALGVELSRRGNRVAFVTAKPKSSFKIPDSSIAVHEWPSERPIHWKDAKFLNSLVWKGKPDCAVGNFGAVNLFATVHWLNQVKVRILWYHTLSAQIDKDTSAVPHSLLFRRWRKALVYWSATHIFTNSIAARDDVIKVFRVPSSKCSVHTLSLADPMPGMTTPARGNQQIRICCVGRFNESKGQDVLVKALGQLKSTANFVVYFIGGGPFLASVESLAISLGVQSRCRFLGILKHAEVLSMLAESDISIVPSRSEAFGFVAIEAMSVGLPIIASRTGGLSSTIRDGIDGYLFEPGSDQELALALDRLIADAGLRSRMGGDARIRFMSDFEQSKIVSQQADFMESLTNLK